MHTKVRPDFVARFKQIMAMPGSLGSVAACYEGIGDGREHVSEEDQLKKAAFDKLDREISRHIRREAGLPLNCREPVFMGSED